MGVVHHHPFYRDLDHHDAANDELVTGDPYDPEWPDKPLRLNLQRHDLADREAAAGASRRTTLLPSGAPESSKRSQPGGNRAGS